MGKINREELFKILDEQYNQCKRILTISLDGAIEKLYNYQGDVIDIKTEISMGQDLEQSLFRAMNEDYYDKQKLLSSVPEEKDDKSSPARQKLYDVINGVDPSVLDNNTRDVLAAGLHNFVTAPEQQFTHEELKKLLDMTVSLILFFREKYGNDNMKYQDIMSIYKKILELL